MDDINPDLQEERKPHSNAPRLRAKMQLTVNERRIAGLIRIVIINLTLRRPMIYPECAAVRPRVLSCRQRARASRRQGLDHDSQDGERDQHHGRTGMWQMARMSTRQIKQHCKLGDESQELIRIAMQELNLSARAYDRILKVSRTIADLENAENITSEHVSEAIQYRTFDRTLWV